MKEMQMNIQKQLQMLQNNINYQTDLPHTVQTAREPPISEYKTVRQHNDGDNGAGAISQNKSRNNYLPVSS